MDGLRDCHTQWSKSEREKQIPYANTYIWNLKKKKGCEERVVDMLIFMFQKEKSGNSME